MRFHQIFASLVLPLAFAQEVNAAAPTTDGRHLPGLAGEPTFEAEDPDTLSSAVLAWVQQQISTTMPDVNLQSLGVWGWSKHSHGTWKVLKVVQPHREGRPIYTITLASAANGATASTLSVQVLMRQMVPVWQTTEAVRKHQPITCDNLTPARKLDAPSLSWQGNCNSLVGLVAKRHLSRGMVLTEADLTPPPTVQAMQTAIVTTRINAVSIEAQAEVLADANVGESVPVRLQGQPKVLRAKVIAPGQLLLAESQP
jgi:flagella basal body P-ring formation protein FlgA